MKSASWCGVGLATQAPPYFLDGAEQDADEVAPAYEVHCLLSRPEDESEYGSAGCPAERILQTVHRPTVMIESFFNFIYH